MTASLRRARCAEGDEGASAVEYALLVAGIAGIIVLIVFALGTVVHGTYSKTCSNFSGQVQGSTVDCTQ